MAAGDLPLDFAISPGGLAYRMHLAEETLKKKADADDVVTLGGEVRSLRHAVVGAAITFALGAVGSSIAFVLAVAHG